MVFKARAMAVYMYDIKNRSHGDVSAMYPRRPVSNSASERMKENLPVCQVFFENGHGGRNILNRSAHG